MYQPEPVDNEIVLNILRKKSLAELSGLQLGNLHDQPELLSSILQLIKDKRAQVAGIDAKAEQLAKEHHVSLATAKRYLERQINPGETGRRPTEAERLAKEHGVSVKTAENFLNRKQRQQRDPLDVMRKGIRRAPDPEPATPEPSARDKWEEKWGRK